MKSALPLVFLLLLSSCGLLATYASDIEMPVEDTAQVVEWVALLPNYDTNKDGVIDAVELDAFITGLITKIVATYAMAAPPPPPQLTVVLPEPTESTQ